MRQFNTAGSRDFRPADGAFGRQSRFSAGSQDFRPAVKIFGRLAGLSVGNRGLRSEENTFIRPVRFPFEKIFLIGRSVKAEIMNKSLAVAPVFLNLYPAPQIYLAVEKAL